MCPGPLQLDPAVPVSSQVEQLRLMCVIVVADSDAIHLVPFFLCKFHFGGPSIHVPDMRAFIVAQEDV